MKNLSLFSTAKSLSKAIERTFMGTAECIENSPNFDSFCGNAYIYKAPLRKGCLYAFPSHPLMVAVVQVATLGTTALALNAITVLLGPIVLATISVTYALPGPPTTKYDKRLVSRTRLPCTGTVAEMASTNAAAPEHTVSWAKAFVTTAPLAPIVQTPLGAMRMRARPERHPKRELLLAVKTDVIVTLKH